ncbi:MAG: threonine-phosphate decarboxylase, partial [Eubacterium sp.]|nr:threonine-phosphate decarboxylase [Eubacterium sp.]
RVSEELAKIPAYKVFPSHCNFCLVKIQKDTLTSEDVFDAAIRRNLMIRDCSTFPFLSNRYFRFCYMMPEQNDRLLAVLKELAN